MTSDLELPPDLAPAPMFTSVMPSASDLEQYWQLASRLCRTEFVPGNLRGKPEAVLAVFLTGRELGIGPMQSLRDVYPVNGRPGMMATLMVQRVRERGHRFTTIRSTPTEATVQIHRRGDSEPQPPVTFTWDDAKRAKLVHKDTYQQYPTALLWSRAASAACRRDASEALGAAVYTPEELDEIPASTTVQVGPAEVPGRPWDDGNPFDGDPFEDGRPARWAIENVVDDEDAKWLLQQPEIDDDYRDAVKAVVTAAGGEWRRFWQTASASDWREALFRALPHEESGAGLRDAADGGGDAPSGSPAPGATPETARGGARTTDILAGASGAATPGPPSPSAPKQEEPPGVARSGAEGANHDSKPGAGPSPPDATRPPDGSPPPGRPSGGTKRSRPAVSPGKAAAGRADPEQLDLAAFEQGQADERDPGQWTR